MAGRIALFILFLCFLLTVISSCSVIWNLLLLWASLLCNLQCNCEWHYILEDGSLENSGRQLGGTWQVQKIMHSVANMGKENLFTHHPGGHIMSSRFRTEKRKCFTWSIITGVHFTKFSTWFHPIPLLTASPSPMWHAHRGPKIPCIAF